MTVDAAVVGAGNVSDTHLSTARRSPRSRLVGVCDTDTSRARDAASKYGTDYYTDVERMLAAVEPDLVHVCTPVQNHLGVGQKAVRAGAAILVEKPATTTVSEFEELKQVVRDRGVPASVVHQSQFGPAMRRARRRISDGKVGTIRGGDLIYTGAPRPDANNRGGWVTDLPGGEFEETLAHPLYLGFNAGYPRDETHVEVTTTLRREYDQGFTYDGVQLQYVTDSGAPVSCKVLAGGHATRLLHIHGDDGALTVDFTTQTVVQTDTTFRSSSIGRARRTARECTARLRDLVRNAYLVSSHKVHGDWSLERRLDPHTYLIDEMYRAVEGTTPVPIPLEEAGWTVRLLESVRKEGKSSRGVSTATD